MEEKSSTDTLTEEAPEIRSSNESPAIETSAEDAAEEAASEAPTEAVAAEQPEAVAPEAEAPEAMAPETEAPEAVAPTPAAETLVHVEDLSKHYGPIRAVDGVSFTVRRGDVLGFLGPNGAGKTTAMRLITGFLEPDSGRIEVAGHDLETESLAARQKVGYLPENAPAYGEMTVVGFLEFIGEARGVDNVPGAIARVLDMTGLVKVQHQTIETLSKGYKRRVGLAQALIHDPEVLILDEPTDGLDPNQKAVVQRLLSNLSSNKCIIVSTHILDEVERICNRAMIISQGKILVDSTPQELIAQAPNHNMIRLTMQRPDTSLAERIGAQDWCARVDVRSESSVDVYPEGGENHLKDLLDLVQGEPLQDVELREGRLEDLFRNVTEGVTT
ncbi:MAG: ABC transporter ATP-binding protein [Acidobacteriota bacterium]